MYDILDSADLEKLARAVEARCKELNVSPKSIEAQMIASQLLEMFQSGATDLQELATRPIVLEMVPRRPRPYS